MVDLNIALWTPVFHKDNWKCERYVRNSNYLIFKKTRVILHKGKRLPADGALFTIESINHQTCNPRSPLGFIVKTKLKKKN